MRAEREARRRLESNQLLRASGIELHFAGADVRRMEAWLPAEYRAMAGRLLELLDRPEVMAIAGDRGRGKTHLACGLVRAFCDAGRSALYRRTKQFFDELSTAPWEEKESVRRRYVLPSLLVLDEVQVRDAERQWQDNELTSLIDRRYAADRATLLLTNFTPAALENNLGESTHRRLLEGGGTWPTPWPRIEQVRPRST